MGTRYTQLFELQLRHPYYADGICRDLEVRMSEATLQVGRSRGWVLRNRPDGLVIATPRGLPGPGHGPLVFFLRAKNPEFASFTEAPTVDASSTFRIYTPGTAKLAASLDLTLQLGQVRPAGPGRARILRVGSDSVGSEDDLAEAEAIAGFYAIVFLPADSLKVTSPVVARISFAARQLFWVYRYNGPAPIENLAIVDKAEAAADRLAFTATEDRSFKSKTKVACSELAKRTLMLSWGPKPDQSRRLPNPSLSSVAATGSDFSLTQVLSDDFIPKTA